MAMKTKTLLLIALFYLPVCVYAQTGNSGLDPSFAKSGILIDTQENFYQVCDLALQPDGKIIVAGADYVARYLPNGKPDSSFGKIGHIAVNKLTDSNGGYASHVFLLPDSKIMVTLGQSNLGEIATRLKPDGSFDSSFGIAGRTIFCCGVLQAAMQADGKLVTAGIENIYYVAVHRITQDGRIDSTFGTNGKSRFYISNTASVSGLGITTDGHIGIIGGNNRNVYYARLDSNGARDSSLCGNGLCFGFGTLYCRDAIVYPDGKVLVAIGGLDDNSSFVARLKADITPDSSFSADGDGFLAVPGLRIIKMLQMPDGRILCAGMSNENFALARVLKDGKGIDSTFGNRGIITTKVSTGYWERAYALALQQDGKILAGGTTQSVNTRTQWDPPRASIVRYLPNAPTGIFKATQPAKGTLEFYPNPASTSLIVVLPASGLLQLFSSEGRLLRQQSCVGPVQGLDIASLPAGTYVLRLQSSDKSYSSLFVKE